MTRWRRHFSSPSGLCHPFRLSSAVEPSRPPRYRLTHCSSSIAASDAKSEIVRLAQSEDCTMTVLDGRLATIVAFESSLGKKETFAAWIRAWMQAAVILFGSGSILD